MRRHGLRVRTTRRRRDVRARAPRSPGRRRLGVAADGTVYAIAVGGGPGVYGSGDTRIEFASSIDGGRTFTRPVR